METESRIMAATVWGKRGKEEQFNGYKVLILQLGKMVHT
jgi:hypothetical protein